MSALRQKLSQLPQAEVFNGLGSCFASISGCRRFDPVTACYCRVSPCERIKHLITCRSQYNMHLFWFVPPPGLAHLPTQFAA
jgi:hypothetical protein